MNFRFRFFASILLLFVSVSLFATSVALADCQDLTGLQVAAGFVSWLNVLRVFAIVAFVACAAVLFKTWLLWLLMMFASIPVLIYELVGLSSGSALIVYAYWLAPQDRLWALLTGCLILAAQLAISGRIRKLKPNYQRYFGILAVVWTSVAFFYANTTIGFIAVLAILGSLGFSAAVLPMMYVIGFQDEDSVPRATIAGFIIMAFAVAIRILAPSHVNPLEAGGLWVGTFVLFLGLLIISSRWYASKVYYLVRQILPVVLGMAAIAVGNVFAIPQLSGIGGTFFVLFLIEKPFDLTTHSVTGLATVGLFVSVGVGAAVWWGQHHMDLIQPYLLF